MRHAAETFPPGDFIRDELEERGWTQSDLAEIMGRPTETVNRLIAGKIAITPETAKGLGAAFGTSATVWLNLEASYQLSRLKQGDDPVQRRARLYDMAPIAAMGNRGWIERTRNVEVLERQVADFFELEDVQEEPAMAVAARAGTVSDGATIAQRAWFYRVRQIARTMRAEPYRQENLQTALEKLRALVIDPTESRHVPRILEAAGVRFLVVEHLPRTKIDGCALWLDERSPVVALSLRYDRIDWFWHTLAHEIGHILNHDAMSIDVNMPDETSEDRLAGAEQERRADEFASTFLVPQQEIEDFIRRVRPLYSKRTIVGFAGRLRVHPGIVVGQLQYRGEISYSHSRNMLSKVRDVIVQAALTDGWGSEISV